MELQELGFAVSVVRKDRHGRVAFTETPGGAARLSCLVACIERTGGPANDAPVVKDLWHFQEKEKAARRQPC